MFENLSERLERSFKILKGQGKITEINVAETLKDVRRALLDADVNYKVAKQFTDTVKAKAMGQNVINALKPEQVMVKIVHDELAALMGGQEAPLNINGNPAIILMSGLQGSGKTTFSGKLARKLKSSKGKRPLLVACDVYRPAAIEQLRVLGESISVPVYMEEDNKNPVQIALNAIAYAKSHHYDLVIVDTAGRLAVDQQMMDEIAAIKEAIHPHETLFVVDSMTGQDAVNTAKEFNDRLDFDGVVLTKLDGDTRGAIIRNKNKVNRLNALVSERTKDLEEEMKKNNVLHNENMKLERNKNSYFVNLSHELRTPLNVISSTNQLLKGLVKKDSIIGEEKLNYYVDISEKNCKRLLNLINNILDNSKLQCDMYEINTKEADIVYLVEETALTMYDYIKSKGIELIIDPEIEEKTIECDYHEIERCIINIVSNAAKYTPEGGTITVGIKDLDDKVMINIKDTGCGIDEKFHEAIFNRFSQASEEDSKIGSGLGLTITKQIIDLHKGEIYVESKLGEGSNFVIILPTKSELN
ncbi:MAG: signal recognition particle protein [Muribaculaceae bacterium]|nr:signal recognition particle protein [Muribaculaceae bacterium]